MNSQPRHPASWPRILRPLLFVIVVLSAIVVTTHVGRRSDFDQFYADAANREPTGAEAMLKQFILNEKNPRAVKIGQETNNRSEERNITNDRQHSPPRNVLIDRSHRIEFPDGEC